MLNKILSLGVSISEAKELIKVSDNIERDYELLKSNYPIQYLIGYVNFYGNKIIVNENVLIPRYETELLVDKVIKRVSKEFVNPKILDLCTGSGAIAISLKGKIDSIVIASDISANALKVAEMNSKINNADIKFIESDLFNNINDKFDIIISNPPYVKTNEYVEEKVKKYEPNIALYAGDDGLYFYKKILSEIKNHLNDKYLIAFEIGCTEGNEIKKIAKEYLNNANVVVEKDYSNKDRYIFIYNE